GSRVIRQSTGGKSAPGKRRSQPGTLPIRKPASAISWVVGRAAAWRSSRRTNGSGSAAIGPSPGGLAGEPGEGGAILATRAEGTVPSLDAAQRTASVADWNDLADFWEGQQWNHRAAEDTEKGENGEGSNPTELAL